MVTILGVKVARLSCAEALLRVRQLIAEHRAGNSTRCSMVCFINAHCLNLTCSEPGFRKIINAADLRLNDGTGLNWAAQRHGTSFVENCVGTDFIPLLCRETRQDGYSFYLLGGGEGVAERATLAWCREYPGLKIAGTHHGFLDNDEEETRRVIDEINASGADVLLVAMGMPRQEQWIHKYRADLQVGAAFAVGALFDFAAGLVPRAPQWMLNNGLEWVYRLRVEPRRLFRRYVIGNPLFMMRVLRDRRRAEKEGR